MCKITASLRATATIALRLPHFVPLRAARLKPQRRSTLSGPNGPRMRWAHGTRRRRSIRLPVFVMLSSGDASPESRRFGRSPTSAPAARDELSPWGVAVEFQRERQRRQRPHPGGWCASASRCAGTVAGRKVEVRRRPNRDARLGSSAVRSCPVNRFRVLFVFVIWLASAVTAILSDRLQWGPQLLRFPDLVSYRVPKARIRIATGKPTSIGSSCQTMTTAPIC